MTHLGYQQYVWRKKDELNAIASQVLGLLTQFYYLMYETLQNKVIFCYPTQEILLSNNGGKCIRDKKVKL